MMAGLIHSGRAISMFSITSSSQATPTNTAASEEKSAQPSQVSTDLCKTSNALPHSGAMRNLDTKAGVSSDFSSALVPAKKVRISPFGYSITEPYEINKEVIRRLPDLTSIRDIYSSDPSRAISNYKNNNVFSLPEYGRLLDSLIKKPALSTIEDFDPQLDHSLSTREINQINNAVGYKGAMVLFDSYSPESSNVSDKVKSYLVRALEKAPELILKLLLGYRKDDVGSVVVVKAWIDKPTNTLEYRLISSFKADGTVDKQTVGGLSKLSDCSDMWLYETGMRFPSSGRQKLRHER